MNDDRPYLEHVREAIRRIASYTAEGREAFMQNKMAQDAVLRNFEIIGEATKRLSDEMKARRPDIPWSDVAGLRDVLIHNYMGVKLDRVWRVIEDELPELQEAITELLGGG